MQFEDVFRKPSGQIEFYRHRGGYFENGRLVNGDLVDRIIVQNLIVDKASELMAARMAPGAVTGASTSARIGNFLDRGLQYLAVGVGVLVDPTLPYDEVTNPVDTTAWNPLDPPPETLADTRLVGELERKEWATWCFLEPDGTETSSLTNVLKLTCTFLEDEANGPLTECGIFGGNATAAKDSGYLFNRRSFRVIHLTDEMRLTIVWKLTF